LTLERAGFVLKLAESGNRESEVNRTGFPGGKFV